MSSKQTKGMRARKIFRALNIDYAPETKRTKQSATKHEEESSDSKKSRSQTLVKRQHDQTDSMISSKRKKTETRLPVKDVSLKISLPIKEQFSIVSISDDKKSAPVSKISSSEQDVLESMPLSTISILYYLLTMDLQSVKVCPYLTASALYFKTKLTCQKFTVYNMTNHHCTCYWFNETAADLTANTFASFLLDCLERHCLSLKLPIVIFSDGCTYQNRNVNLANALLNFSKLHGVTITQKFLVLGHTQMECDSVHSAIERRLKNREIHLPSDYSTVAKEARNRSPYEVVTIDHEFIKNYADHKNWVYKSIRPGRKAGEAQVTDIQAIKYTPDCKIQVKLDFDDDWFDLPQRQQVINHEVTYQRLHSGPIPISSTKYNHLQQLKSVIPQDCHAFYDNLPKSN